MLTSMTGHGEARREGRGFEIQIELRSVNNRFLRIVTRISEELTHLQAALEDVVRTQVTRGTVFLTVRINPTSRHEFFKIDHEVVRTYHSEMLALRDELGTREEIRVKDILLLPGAVQTEETLADNDEFRQSAHDALDEALRRLNDMRLKEGRHLLKEFRARQGVLVGLLDTVRGLAPEAITRYRDRLEERVRQLLANHEVSLSPEDLIREVAIMAERSDISEEISRMESHLEQFEESLDSRKPVGRKIEFIIQEMFREANTMASKSIHPDLNRILVEYKSELDRLKEQVQNVE